MATYRKRGKSWEYRIRYKHPASGDWVERSKGGFKTEPAARKAAIEEERLLIRGVDITNAQLTVSEFLEWWFTVYKKENVSDGTARNIRNHLNRVINEIGSVPMDKLTKPMYQQFINKIAPSYSKRTLQTMNSTISEAFEEAIQEDIIYKNPVKRITYPRTVKQPVAKKKTLEVEEYMQLFQLVKVDWKDKHPHYFYLTPLLVASGARIGELCALDLKDFTTHLDDVSGAEYGRLKLNKTIVRVAGQYVIKKTTKTGQSGEREIGIDPVTTQMMKEWLLYRKKYLMKHPYAKNNHFFMDGVGNFVKPLNYADALENLCKRHDFQHVHPHMYRHTHETLMWESDVSDINFISARMGDKNKKVLLDNYGHMSKRSEQMNMMKINVFMSRLADGYHTM